MFGVDIKALVISTLLTMIMIYAIKMIANKSGASEIPAVKEFLTAV